jgi:uncharacterized membrane protein YqjE
MFTRDSPGLISDVSSLASNGLRAMRTRLELLTIELKEEKAWVLRFIVVASAAVYLLSFGTLLAILALSLAMPESTRPAVLGGFGGVMLVAGIGAVIWIVSAAKKRSPPFQDLIDVLKNDEEGLAGKRAGTVSGVAANE